MKFLALLSCLCFVWPAAAGSVNKDLLERHFCAGPDAETARVLADYPDAVRHILTPEQVLRFARSTALEPLSMVLYFEAPQHADTYYVIAFRDGCRVKQGGMHKYELRQRIGK